LEGQRFTDAVDFRGDSAAASLKLFRFSRMLCSMRHFRGDSAAASLKRILHGSFPASVFHFRGDSAAASLKHHFLG